jgi:TorA maturation chaperone TorD
VSSQGANLEGACAYFRIVGSLLFSQPGTSSIKMLKDERLFDELPFAQSNLAAMEGQQQMNEWLASAAIDALAEQARVDYVRLLVGLDKVLAAPWASVYLDVDKLLFSEQTLFVRRYFERYGMQLKDKYSEPDDHIGLELEFIACLLELDECSAAYDFAQKFVATWIDRWNSDVQEYAQSGYYRALGNLALGGIRHLIETQEFTRT